MPSSHLVLLGPRAAGKSRLGGAVAALLERPFIDLDDRVRARFGNRSAREIWASEGEPAWRRGELAALEIALGEPPSVIALGGGTPIIPEARMLLESARVAGRTRCVLLLASAGELAARLERAPGDRPPLTAAGRGAAADSDRARDASPTPASEVAAVLAERLPIYRALADAEIDTGTLDEAAATRALLEAWRRGQG